MKHWATGTIFGDRDLIERRLAYIFELAGTR